MCVAKSNVFLILKSSLPIKEKQGAIGRRIVDEANWAQKGDINDTWNKMVSCIMRVVTDVLGESKGSALLGKDTPWWNEDVKKIIHINRDAYLALKNNDETNFERYKQAKRETELFVRLKQSIQRSIGETRQQRDRERDLYDGSSMREGDKRLGCREMRYG